MNDNQTKDTLLFIVFMVTAGAVCWYILHGIQFLMDYLVALS